MQKGYHTLAGLAYFYRDGAAFTLPAPGTVSRTAKPGATDPGWLDLGHVDINTKATVSEEVIKRNMPGRRVDYDVLQTGRELTHNLTLHELQNLVFELLFGATDLTAAGQYNPLEGGNVKGWLKVQEYNQNDTLINTHDVYVYVKPPGDFKRDDKYVRCEVEMRVLWSSLNTGNLAANPAA